MRNINAEKINLGKLFSSEFWFTIPEYQRSYVWKEENVETLLDDTWSAFKYDKESEYFIGSLVLKNAPQKIKEYDVLDGQQRLTTLILSLAAIKHVVQEKAGSFHDSESSQKVIKQLLIKLNEAIHQDENPFDAIPDARVRLVYKIRDNVEDFIQEFVVCDNKPFASMKDDLQRIAESTENISKTNMANALLTAYRYFSEKNLAEIIEFCGYLFNRVVCIYVSTAEFDDAYRLFTIINNRGIPLTASDIIKAVNIGAIPESEREKYAEIWEESESEFGEGGFDRFLAQIRFILLKDKAREGIVQEFEEKIYAKGILKKGKATFETIMRYRRAYDASIRLSTIAMDNNYYNMIYIMQLAMPSTDWMAALMMYYDKYHESHIYDFLRKLEMKCSGDWILQVSPTIRLMNIAKIMKAIEASSSPDELLKSDAFYVDGNALRHILDGQIYGRSIARYLLLKLEVLHNDGSVRLSNYKWISIEHVLPQNPEPNSYWTARFRVDEQKEWTHKLANLILLNRRKNSALARNDFAVKKERYFKDAISVFPRSNAVISMHNDWNVDVLKKLQEEIIQRLVS